MKTEDKSKNGCPVRSVLNGIGDKWSILVIDMLGNLGIMRFNEISKSLGNISQKMLTVTLRSLEADGIIFRKIYAEIPPHVEYGLTDLGDDLLPHISSLINWSKQNMEAIKVNRELFKRSHCAKTKA
nr:helix-turn-helix domain-containing protein [uncultured Bacteroides sp.]